MIYTQKWCVYLKSAPQDPGNNNFTGWLMFGHLKQTVALCATLDIMSRDEASGQQLQE